MYYPTASEIESAALLACPGFQDFTEAAQDDAIADGVMWLTIWRSVYPAVGSPPHGLGPVEGEVPPVALLRASKMACEAFDALPFAEKRPVREAAVRWLHAWRFVLAMGQPPVDYVRADPRFVAGLRRPDAPPAVERDRTRPRLLVDGYQPLRRKAANTAFQFGLAAKWAPDLGWFDRLLIWVTHRTLRLADRLFGRRDK